MTTFFDLSATTVEDYKFMLGKAPDFPVVLHSITD